MSGHSKWANIKRKKQANDQVRGSEFSKLSRLITLAVIEGGGITDPENNVKLRLAIEKAKQLNMPKDNIQRAIDRGVGPDRVQLKETAYEAFAPSGVALIILVTSDNVNRTLSEVRNILDCHHGKLGNQGSVSYLFTKCGMIVFNNNQVKEDNVFSFAEKIQAFDIDQDKTNFIVYFPFENLGRVKDILGEIKYEQLEIDYKPNSLIVIENKQKAQQILDLIDALENLDDVQRVFGNFDILDKYLI